MIHVAARHARSSGDSGKPAPVVKGGPPSGVTGAATASVASAAKAQDDRAALWKQVEGLLDKRRPEQAIALLKKQIGDAEDDAMAQLVYGHAYAADGRSVDALKAAGKSVEYFTYSGQPHVFTTGPWTTSIQRSADFLKQHLA